ncbi:MAG TPA: S8 family serine peptidase, partial [Fibrobacteria bacterium]|nr:S8 family serine peptidase [Fibrobacteria bacterium]
THVAGIAAGNGWGSEDAGGRRYQFRGVAPKATLIPYWESGDVNNHSFTNGFEAFYNYADAGVDERYSNHNGILPDANNVGVWAAANNGGPRPQYGVQRGWYSMLINAKNPIKVAAAGADGRHASFSSMGPTRDGRIGPDITAPGEAVFSTWQGGRGYAALSGTSISSPQVTGIVALLLQKYQDQVLRPLGLDIHNQPPWNSTVKAVLIHTARDMVDLEGAVTADANPEFAAAGHAGRGAVHGPGPDFATGYGMVDAGKAAAYMDPSRFREAVISASQTRAFTLEVGADQPSLRVTLAWDDPPFQGVNDASGAYARKLVNDLDLRLISPSGTVHLPWVLDHAPLHDGSIPADGLDPVTPEDILENPARRGRDSLNNVEVVDVTGPETGAWTVEVTGSTIAVDQSLEPGMNQDFSLVSDIEPDNPSAPTSPDLMVADIAWTPENPSPNDRVHFRAVLRNAGSAALPAGPVEVRFLISGVVVARGEVNAEVLEPDDTLEVFGDLGAKGDDGVWTAISGLTSVSAWVDPSDRIAETRETNNARLETLEVPRFPHPWQLVDIGRVGIPGFGYFFDQTFFVSGEGEDIQGTADACSFVHQPLAGDGEIHARL